MMSSRYVTNCYNKEILNKNEPYCAIGNNRLYLVEDHGVNRIFFFAESMADINGMMAVVEPGRYYLEYVTREKYGFVPDGATCKAAMMRVSNVDIKHTLDASEEITHFKHSVDADIATENDAEEINGILWSVFRTEVSHLLTTDELRSVIRKNQVMIHRDEECRIDAILQFEMLPRKFYINQIVNLSEKRVIHSILLERLTNYVEKGGRYVYAWVDEANTASVRFHEKYGMKHDGMWNMVYELER